MSERHTRANECGCVETWDPVPGCAPDQQTWAYGLWLGCDEHLEGHQLFLEAMRNFRNESE